MPSSNIELLKRVQEEGLVGAVGIELDQQHMLSQTADSTQLNSLKASERTP
jgi:hypothetical protein